MAEDKEQKEQKKSDGKDQVALELMKFIADTTGYGKGGGGGAGFGGKPAKSPEEYTDALLQLYERCRSVVGKAG